MGNTVLGVVAPLPQGAWNSTTTYQKLSVVREGNSSYIAKSANVNIQPGVTDSWETYWMLLNEDGDTGEQGPQGATGVGVPDGGLKGDILVKRSQDNYDDEWVDPANITVGNATKAAQDENGNNIADTYQTKQDSTTQNTALQTQITSNTQGITQNSQLISRNSARLTNLEQRISPSPFVIDSTVAYVKDVPENALPYAELQKLGGMTYRVNLGTDDAPNYVLRSAPVTEVESVGINIWNEQWESGLINYDTGALVASSTNIRTKNYIPVQPNTTYYKLAPSVLITLYYDKSYNVVGRSWTDSNRSFTTPNNAYYMKFCFGTYSDSGTVTEYNHDICINSSNESINGKYYPYTKSTLSIPEAVQALDGYGNGINESVYNYITWNPEGNVKTYTKAVGVADMGSIVWTVQALGATTAFAATITNMKDNENGSSKGTILTAPYSAISPNDMHESKTDKVVCHNRKVVRVADSAYADVASFKAAMAGVMLYYELATPEVTDITGLITADNLIPVQGNGTITFVNEYGYAVPSTVEYMT